MSMTGHAQRPLFMMVTELNEPHISFKDFSVILLPVVFIAWR